MDSKIPNIRFKGFTDAWEQRRLGEVTIYQNGKGYEDSQSSSGKFELINLNSISIDGGLKSSGKYIESADKTLLTDDLVMVLSDVGKGDLLGRVAIIPKDNYYVLNQRVALIRPKNKQQTNYLFSYINSHQRYFKLHGAGMSQLNISKGSVENFPLLLPSLPEQQQIGTFFAHLDTLISLHQRKCDQTKELKKTMLQKIFPKKGETVPEIRFPEFTDAWEECKLGEVGNTFTGLSGKTKEDFGHGEGKFITYMNVFSNPVADLDGLEGVEIDNKQFQVKAGDVLFTTSSETPEEVGMSSMWLGNADNIYLNSFCFGYRPTIEFDNYYLAFMFRSAPIRKKFQLLAQGISRYNISKNKVMEMSIPVPSIEEQEKIGSFFKHLDDTIALHQRKLDLLKEQKKGFLQKMFV